MQTRSFSLGFLLVCAGCTAPVASSSPTAAPEPEPAPRVFLEAVVFDAPPEGFAEIGVNPAEASFTDIVARAGATHISAPSAIVADDVVMRMPPHARELGSPMESYELAMKPHILEHDQVRLDIDLALGGKRAKTVVTVADKQLVVLGTEIVVEARRYVLLVRPNIIRSSADLEAIAERKRRAASP